MNKAQEAKAFVIENKLGGRTTDTHYQVNCFLCTDTRERLGIDKETGAWRCFNCKSAGKKISSLKYAYSVKGKFKNKDTIKKPVKEEKCKIPKNLHVRFHKQIFKTKENGVAKYLVKERGISKEAIRHFKLGHRREFKGRDAGEHLAIPYLIDGNCVNIKYRSLDPEVDKKWKWRREQGGITALFNDEVLDNYDHKEIFIVESEIDCISLWDMGVKNVVGLTAGADTFKQEWYDRLERFEKVYLLLDNDEAGQLGAKKIAKRLGMGRCYNIVLPEDVKDPNDFLLKYEINRFIAIKSKAKQFDVPDAVSLRQALETIYHQRFIEDNEDVIGFNTQFKRLNNVLGPLKPGYLFIISARPKVGKTTLVLNFMKYWGECGVNVGMYQVEMRPERIAEKFTIMVNPDIRTIEDTTPQNIIEAQYKLPIDNMHFHYHQSQNNTPEAICDKIRELVQRYGIKIFCFDNLHFICRGENENALIDIYTREFKLLAEELDIVFILVTHPKKASNNKQLKNEDMKGSSSIYQDADVILLAHRKDLDGDVTPDELNGTTESSSKSLQCDLRATSRWHSGGNTMLAFHETRSLFSEKGILFNELVKENTRGNKRKRKQGSM